MNAVSQLKNQTVWVTGASRGIGQAIALACAQAGATVIGTATSDSGAAAITDALAAHGGYGIALNVTVQSYDQHMDFGLMADLGAMPDVQAFADGLKASFEQLRALPVKGAAVAKETTPTRASAPTRRIVP